MDEEFEPEAPPAEDEDPDEPTTRAEFQNWRSKFKNNVQLCATLYQDRHLVCVPVLCVLQLQVRIKMLALCSEDVSKEFYNNLQQQKQGQALGMSHGAAIQLEWTAGRSAGSWFRTVQSTLGKIHSTNFLQELTVSVWHGHRPAAMDEEWVQRDAAILEEAWLVLLELAAARTWSQAMFTFTPPYLLATIFGEAAAGQWSLAWLKRLDAGLAVAHRIRRTSPDTPVATALNDLLRDLWWHSTPICLEILQCARDAQYDKNDDNLRILGFGLFAGPSNTKHSAEDVFAHLTHVQQRSQKGSLRMSKSHDWVLDSDV
ncbi:unnamed protein product [Symbiodinium sp. CCMP2592]|nr:unnamed protein product [Symbiodinium sp. CCMP2592]